MPRAIFLLTILFLGAGSALAVPGAREPVNAVIGDRSAESVTAPLSEQERLVVHLRYVEGLLRARSTEHLSKEQRAGRERALDRLRAYRERGEFPRNIYVEGRAPVFVDESGVRCAVGAIAEPDIGSAEVERIARVSRLAYLPEIESPALMHWAERSGLSLRELAMIQPTYGGGGSVEVPRDPTPVRMARRRLDRAWRSCRNQAYPANIGWGVSRIRSRVSFRAAGKKQLRARLKLELVEKARPSELNPAPTDKEVQAFFACVKKGFAGGRYYRHRGVGPGTRYGLPPPSYGGPLVREDNGELGHGPAAQHVLHELNALRTVCEIPRRALWKVELEVNAKGELDSIGVQRHPAQEGDNSQETDRVGACITEKLPSALRFPPSKLGGKIQALGP